MNPHKGRSAPRKKKKAACKERKMPFGSCVATLSCFEKIVAETAKILEEEVFARRELYTMYSVAARGGSEVGQWLDETISAQKALVREYVREISRRARPVRPFVGIPWSVCVVPCYVGMTDYEGFGLVCVVLLDYVIARPVGKIVPGLEAFLKWHRRASDACDVQLPDLFAALCGESESDARACASRAKASDEGDCWLCLEPFDTAEVHVRWDADCFCCGHLLCTKCTPTASKLKECGVCRAVRPPLDGLEERIMRRAKTKG